jgi:hypothetical protein
MNIGVRGGLTSEHSDFTAEEKNRSRGILASHSSGCLVSDRELKVYVKVPPKVPGITCQTDPEAYKYLVTAFELCIEAAVNNEHPSVAIPALGVTYQKWNHLQSASAAREAIENITEEVPDDFTVFFCVEYDYVELWDQVMTF